MAFLKKNHLVLLDLFILNVAYWGIHLAVHPETSTVAYIKLGVVINLIWAFIAYISRKFHFYSRESFFVDVQKIGVNALYMMYTTTVFTVLMGLTGFTKLHVIGTFVVYYLITCAFLLTFYGLQRRMFIDSRRALRSGLKRQLTPQSVTFWILDLLLLLLAFYTVHFLKYTSLSVGERGLDVMIILSAVWLLTSQWTGKFKRITHRNFFYALSPFIKATFLSAALVAVLVVALELFVYSRGLVFGTLLLLFILELPFVYLRTLKYAGAEEDIESVEQVRSLLSQDSLVNTYTKPEVREPSFSFLRDVVLKNQPELFPILNAKLNLEEIDKDAVQVVDTSSLASVYEPVRKKHQMMLVFHQVNDLKRINEFLLHAHNHLQTDGYLIVKKVRIENIREKLQKQFPVYIARAIYLFYFLWHRVAPKIPVMDSFYFLINKGKSRAVTNPEFLGRLYFCGYELEHVERINGHRWYIAKKRKVPAFDKNPSYGPLIQLKRIGFQGKPILINKFRTMHPYAEYLQDFVYQKNNLTQSGKFADDFRLTTWGRFFRKYWIDELPQFINFIKGDIQLFGVRAISTQYFSLYPKELQQLRTQFKPGLIPPYYADLPSSFDEIVASELKYLKQKKNAPFRTDVVYFSKAVYNIVFRKAHSS